MKQRGRIDEDGKERKQNWWEKSKEKNYFM